jgi:hypothetical protein
MIKELSKYLDTIIMVFLSAFRRKTLVFLGTICLLGYFPTYYVGKLVANYDVKV